MKLYNFWRSSASWRVRIGLRWKNVPFEYVPVSLTGEQFTPEHLARNPIAQVPVLELSGEKLEFVGAVARDPRVPRRKISRPAAAAAGSPATCARAPARRAHQFRHPADAEPAAARIESRANTAATSARSRSSTSSAAFWRSRRSCPRPLAPTASATRSASPMFVSSRSSTPRAAFRRHDRRHRVTTTFGYRSATREAPGFRTRRLRRRSPTPNREALMTLPTPSVSSASSRSTTTFTISNGPIASCVSISDST